LEGKEEVLAGKCIREY